MTGLSPEAEQLLGTIELSPGLTIRELADALGWAQTRTLRVLRPLLQARLLMEDQRGYDQPAAWLITPKGKEALR